MRTWWCFLLGSGLLVAASGCVRAPKNIEVNIASPRAPEPVDASQVPHPTTLDEAQAELNKAYQNIQYLQDENARLSDKADKFKHERDDCRHQLKKHEKEKD
jgi:septal ring factor EnvC (AmiA/AmiB activator)